MKTSLKILVFCLHLVTLVNTQRRLDFWGRLEGCHLQRWNRLIHTLCLNTLHDDFPEISKTDGSEANKEFWMRLNGCRTLPDRLESSLCFISVHDMFPDAPKNFELITNVQIVQIDCRTMKSDKVCYFKNNDGEIEDFKINSSVPEDVCPKCCYTKSDQSGTVCDEPKGWNEPSVSVQLTQSRRISTYNTERTPSPITTTERNHDNRDSPKQVPRRFNFQVKEDPPLILSYSYQGEPEPSMQNAPEPIQDALEPSQYAAAEYSAAAQMSYEPEPIQDAPESDIIQYAPDYYDIRNVRPSTERTSNENTESTRFVRPLTTTERTFYENEETQSIFRVPVMSEDCESLTDRLLIGLCYSLLIESRSSDDNMEDRRNGQNRNRSNRNRPNRNGRNSNGSYRNAPNTDGSRRG